MCNREEWIEGSVNDHQKNQDSMEGSKERREGKERRVSMRRGIKSDFAFDEHT